MKKIIALLLICSTAIAQESKTTQIVHALKVMNIEHVEKSIDPILTEDAKRMAEMFSFGASEISIDALPEYDILKQKYFVYLAMTKDAYTGEEITNFFSKEYSNFYMCAQFKHDVGIYANKDICIILFYREKNVLTVLNLNAAN